MAIASVVVAGLAVIVSGCSVYWTLQLRKAYRRIAAIRAERQATPQPVAYSGVLTKEASDRIQSQMVAAMRQSVRLKP